ncbi:MAG: adenylate kinase [Candidatus Marinimicrobia bacterium]|jgi:adenylate kinase|nr:adenylate kinase [Candidatus Neomarinimicrobiota bacterium]MDP6789097.1 adenylate kinase [Candidatus Neomarinimicrobiota bacterium]MDP7072499.1 adenylate kinase [Candidatus Neomarinimicrobiota bacterium]
MKLILLGPPGVGKGTQAARLKNHFDIIHLSTGEILRGEMAKSSSVGIQARQFIDAGNLVPDEILLKMMNNRLREDDCEKGYILDGFPRTIPQAEGLDNLMNELEHQLNAVISITADQEELVKRLVLRAKDSGRSDDTELVIQERQRVYWNQTSPLIDYYTNKNLLKSVDGLGSIEEITERILKVL